MRNIPSLLVLCLFLLIGRVSADSTPQFTTDPGPMPTQLERLEALTARSVSAADPAFYIVLLQDAPLARYDGTVRGLAATSPAALGSQRLDLTAPASVAYLDHLENQQAQLLTTLDDVFGRNVETLFHYKYALNGFAAWLTPQEAAYIATLPNVSLVEREQVFQLQTDAGPNWIEASQIWDGSATYDNVGTKGEGIVIGVIDTGVNTANASFSDTPADGYVYENPLGEWFGFCLLHPVLGSNCNNKLLGLYDFTTLVDPEDGNNHGSHTASTAGGNAVTITYAGADGEYSADFSISGVAPHANIISYKACFDIPLVGLGGCLNLSTAAAIDQAVGDGVDVINYSIGGASGDPWSDSGGTAFLSALASNVLVAVAAGNDGPGPETVGSPSNAPWVTSVAATKHDRALTNSISGMTDSGGAPLSDIIGTSYNAGYGPAQVVYAGDYPNSGDAALCEAAFDSGTFSGEIVICDRGVNARVDKCTNVGAGGAGGCILANDIASGASTNADPHTIPSVHISYENGLLLKAHLTENPNLQATISDTNIGSDPAFGDIMAGFSSRGPDATVYDVLKPDIGAPGVDILAAYAAANGDHGLLSGTSMASPHVAGTFALMRSLHPTWSPTEVRSALMLTSFNDPYGGKETHSFFDDDGVTLADPHDVGAGRVDMSRAAMAGFVLHETVANFTAANPSGGGDPTALNLASMSDGTCASTCAFTRTLKSTLDTTTNWTVSAHTTNANRSGVVLSPSLPTFSLAPDSEQVICVTADVTNVASLSEWYFGRITFTPDNPDVPVATMPVAVRAVNGTGNSCANFIPTDIGLQQMDTQPATTQWLPLVLIVALVGVTVLFVQKRRVD